MSRHSLRQLLFTGLASLFTVAGVAAQASAHDHTATRTTPTTRTLPLRLAIMKPASPGSTETQVVELSEDEVRRMFFTSRPLLAVGTVRSIDSASSTVTVAIDQNLSDLPITLTHKAKVTGQDLESLRRREFPPQRTFRIGPMTMLVDDRAPLPKRRGEPRPQPRIGAGDFKPGDRVSLLFRMEHDPNRTPYAINLSKVDPARTYFATDFDPTGVMGRQPMRGTRPTTGVTAGAIAPMRWDGLTTPSFGTAPRIHARETEPAATATPVTTGTTPTAQP